MLLIALLFFMPDIVASPPDRKLKVGFAVEPPFIIKKDNQFTGVNMALWKKVADSLSLSYSIKEYALSDLIVAIENGDIDIAISPLTVTATRIKKFGFSQPYYITNLAFATKYKKDDSGIISFIADFFSIGFLKAILTLFLVILIFGLVVWLAERKKNRDQFGEGSKGLGDGIWWSAVTMSTVGYGDKAPVTRLGRGFAIIWMFTAVIVISGLTASISSSLTVHKLNTHISDFDDLRKSTVGTIPNSGTAEFLQRYKIHFIDYNNVKDGLKAVDDGNLEAFVYDEAILNYYVKIGKYDEVIKVIPSSYFKEYFSFASNNNNLLKNIDEVLIGIIESDEWKSDLENYNIEYRD